MFWKSNDCSLIIFYDIGLYKLLSQWYKKEPIICAYMIYNSLKKTYVQVEGIYNFKSIISLMWSKNDYFAFSPTDWHTVQLSAPLKCWDERLNESKIVLYRLGFFSCSWNKYFYRSLSFCESCRLCSTIYQIFKHLLNGYLRRTSEINQLIIYKLKID